MRHSWRRDTTVIQWRATDAKKHQCIHCGLIRWTSGFGRMTSHLYKRGNRYVGDSFDAAVPPCEKP